MTIESTLWLLANSDEPEDRREWAVLYWKWHGFTHKEVGDQLHYSNAWVQRYTSAIHRRFGTPRHRDPAVMNKWLEENVFPALEKFLEDNPDTIKELPESEEIIDDPPPPPPPDPQKAIEKKRPEVIKIPPHPLPPRRACLVLAIFGVLTVLVGFVAYRLGVNSVPSVPASTTEAIQVVESFPTTTFETTKPAASPIPPTNTLAPTRTLTPTITPNPNIFISDFSSGLDPSWEVIYGNPVIVNEQLSASDATLISIGDASWVNYQIEFDIRIPHCVLGSDADALGVRATDRDNMLLFMMASCDSQWYYVENGQRKAIPETNKGGIRPSHFTMTVEGNKFTIYLDSQLLVSIIYEGYQSGNIYFQIKPNSTYDNFKITLLE